MNNNLLSDCEIRHQSSAIAAQLPMRALCMCLVLLLSSCASVDQWAKAVFTPPPSENIYPTDEDEKTLATVFLTMAMAAVGISINLSELKSMGYKPFVVGLIAAITVGFISLIYIETLIKFI